MDRLWAPWRSPYLKKVGKKEPCFLCATPRQKRDRRNHIVARGKTCFAILNLYPYNVGHLLVSPYAHKADLQDLTNEETLETRDLLSEFQERLKRISRPHGFNVGINLGRAGGAGVLGHLHVHLVPRWEGDTNFMPVIGETKVMPISLEAVYNKLVGVRLKARPSKLR